MTREQLEHVLRAASQTTHDPDVVVIGSQSVLGTIPEDRLPLAATASIEVDVAFFDDPDDRKTDQVDGAISELSSFHETFGYYAQGVSVTKWSGARTGCLAVDRRERHGRRHHDKGGRRGQRHWNESAGLGGGYSGAGLAWRSC